MVRKTHKFGKVKYEIITTRHPKKRMKKQYTVKRKVGTGRTTTNVFDSQAAMYKHDPNLQ